MARTERARLEAILWRWLKGILGKRRKLAVWTDPAYRLPLSSLGGGSGIEVRRADFAAWYLIDQRVVRASDLRRPVPISFAALGLVHPPAYLESLTRAEQLARIFAVPPAEVPVDEVLHTVRLACGATLAASRFTLESREPALNLLGGFHHAAPERGAGMCPVNDIAVAVAILREMGFSGRVAVLDLDAHPPDGTAACMGADPSVWIGSLSGSDWGDLGTVDETVLPRGCDDAGYLDALGGLLRRMPRPDLAYVIAGGDVLAGDRLGLLGMSLAGVQRRDQRVAEALAGIPSVWLPGGGYTHDAWRVLAGTGMVLATGHPHTFRPDYDPLHEGFARIAMELSPTDLGKGDSFDLSDLEADLGLGPRREHRLLGYYTAQGIEYALSRYGITTHLERLGFQNVHIRVDRATAGDRAQAVGRHGDAEHRLIEMVLGRERIMDQDLLFVHWLSLENPRAEFTLQRPRLPGQEQPGLGLAREMAELLRVMAARLELGGVAFRPIHFHVAYTARYGFRFVDSARQGRFEAMLRDLGSLPLVEATQAVAAGRVLLGEEPYQWEASQMAYWLGEPPLDPDVVSAERERSTFRLLPEAVD